MNIYCYIDVDDIVAYLPEPTHEFVILKKTIGIVQCVLLLYICHLCNDGFLVLYTVTNFEMQCLVFK